jgi:integrase
MLLEGRTMSSIQKQRQQINAFLRVVERYFETEQKYLAGVKNIQKRAERRNKKDLKQSFNDEQLMAIFTELENQRIRYPERYWLVWIHLFSGMRTNEIAQLTFENVIKDKNSEIWYFNITDSELFQKIKPPLQSNKRKVPIHSFLIELGFLDFYDKRAKEVKSKKSLILPVYNKEGKTTPLQDLKAPPRKDFCDSVADWFNAKLLGKKLEIKTAQVSIYSLRHTFSDAMKRFNSSAIISEIMGHSTGTSTTEASYGSERALITKSEAVEQLWFENFDYRSFLSKKD